MKFRYLQIDIDDEDERKGAAANQKRSDRAPDSEQK